MILAGFLLRRVARNDRAALDRRLMDSARAQASVVDGEIAATIRGLQTLAEALDIRENNLAGVYDYVRRVQQTQPTWIAVVLSGRDRELVSTLVPFERPLAAAVEPDSIAEVFRTGQPAVGPLKAGPSGRMAFAVRVPVKAGTQIRFVLSAIISPATLAAIMKDPSIDEWSKVVVDSAGTVVVRFPDPERSVGQRTSGGLIQSASANTEGVQRGTSLDGTPIYVGYARGPISNWVSAVTVRQEVLDASARRPTLALIGLGGLLMLVGAAAVLVISERMSRDIAGAAAAADRLASGDEPAMPSSSVTEVERLSAALTRASSTLVARERERDEHIARAEEARRVAEAANLAKDEFLATLGHELRNPLAPALTALHLMRLRGDATNAREREIIERQVKHLARLVDDLLDVSRARSGRIELRRHPFEIVHAIEAAIEIASPLITSRRQRLRVDVPATGLTVNGDETRLTQVFSNLLNNAAKYSDGPGQIAIAARAENDRVVVSVTDDGLGIEQTLLPRVFEQFSQGRQSLDREQGGLGLGLSVAKALVELHGGEIEAQSGGPGCGSVFTVRLPRSVAHPETTSAGAPSTPVPVSSRRVLIVDDNHDATEMFSDMLRLAGYAVATAHDGMSALRLNQSFEAHVGVLDIGLPAMDGLELARRLRQSETGRNIRLIAMTGYGQANDIEASRAAGFDRHLVKPVAPDDLLEAIRQMQ